VDEGGVKIVQQRGSMRIMHGKRTVSVAKRGEDGLYHLQGSKCGATALYTTPVETAELWHRRFGHLGYGNLFKPVALRHGHGHERAGQCLQRSQHSGV